MPRTNRQTVEKETKLKQLPQEKMEKLHTILNKYISSSHTKNVRYLANRLSKKFGHSIEHDIIEEALQEIYVYMYINPEKVFEFNETGNLQRLVNTLIYHLTTLNNAAKKIKSRGRMNFFEDVLNDEDEFVNEGMFEEECEYNYVNDALDPRLPNEERLELHRMALKDVKDYLQENPNSKMNIALERLKTESTSKPDVAYRCGLNYCATMSYKFLKRNSVALDLHPK